MQTALSKIRDSRKPRLVPCLRLPDERAGGQTRGGHSRRVSITCCQECPFVHSPARDLSTFLNRTLLNSSLVTKPKNRRILQAMNGTCKKKATQSTLASFGRLISTRVVANGAKCVSKSRVRLRHAAATQQLCRGVICHKKKSSE